MTQINEVYEVYQYIYNLLSTDATLVALLPAGANGIWRGIAEEGTAPPYVTFQYQGGLYRYAVSNFRLALRGSYLVKAVGPLNNPALTGDQEALIAQIANRTKQLLHASSGTTAQANIINVKAMQPIWIDENDNGAKWLHAGDEYEVVAQQIGA